LTDEEGIAMAKKCLLLARDNGVNLFDNAETYGNPVGEAERIMGEAMRQLREEDATKWRRSDIIVTTKVRGVQGNTVWSSPVESSLTLCHSTNITTRSCLSIALVYISFYPNHLWYI
jgi:aryl-alcohol dehydrogenase-like predicted oxidoreductase